MSTASPAWIATRAIDCAGALLVTCRVTGARFAGKSAPARGYAKVGAAPLGVPSSFVESTVPRVTEPVSDTFQVACAPTEPAFTAIVNEPAPCAVAFPPMIVTVSEDALQLAVFD